MKLNMSESGLKAGFIQDGWGGGGGVGKGWFQWRNLA